MNSSQRPYFPYGQIEVPNISYASFNEQTACDWNVKMTKEGCNDPYFPISNFYAKVEWQAVKFDVVKESSQNGYGDVDVDSTRVDPVYSFITWTDEYNLWYFYKFIYGTQNILLENNSSGTGSLLAKDIEIQDQVELNGVHKLTVSFKSVRDDLNYHGAFGLSGCCNPLYSEVPAEECDENSGGIDNNVPPCDQLIFNISESNSSLIAFVNGAPSSYSISWYWRKSDTDVWQLLINNASSVSLNQYGIYRAVLTAQLCGQYIDQYLYQNPCNNFDVRIRRSNNYGLIAESNGATTFEWEFNDGSGWTSLPDTDAAIIATLTGDYRVTASKDDCEDQDTYYMVVSDNVCDFDVSIDIDGTNATAITDAANPTYQWTFEDETGNTSIGTGISIPLSETGIYWLLVNDGTCGKSTYKFYKKPDECQKIEICNWDEMPMPQTTLIACCDDCPSVSLSIVCINRTLTISGLPSGSTIDWSGPNGFTATGNPVTFPSDTPSGLFVANVVADECIYSATYDFRKPNAGTAIGDIEL